MFDLMNIFRQQLSVRSVHLNIIKRAHPDRARNEEDRLFREEMSKRANMARDLNDIDTLLEISITISRHYRPRRKLPKRFRPRHIRRYSALRK
jgi:hypothetical protein